MYALHRQPCPWAPAPPAMHAVCSSCSGLFKHAGVAQGVLRGVRCTEPAASAGGIAAAALAASGSPKAKAVLCIAVFAAVLPQHDTVAGTH